MKKKTSTTKETSGKLKTIKLDFASDYAPLLPSFNIAFYDEGQKKWFASALNRYFYFLGKSEKWRNSMAHMQPIKKIIWMISAKGMETFETTKSEKWADNKESAFYKANLMKFTQNIVARDMLLGLNPTKVKLVDPYAREDAPDLVKTLWKVRKALKDAS